MAQAAACNHLIADNNVWQLGNNCLKALVNGQEETCLLDSGCDRTVFPRRIVAESGISSTNQGLKNADGSRLDVVGEADILLCCGEKHDMLIPVHGVVAADVPDILLGRDFLLTARVTWDVPNSKLFVRDRELSLVAQPSIDGCRRLGQTTEIEPALQVESGSEQKPPMDKATGTDDLYMETQNGTGQNHTVLVPAPLECPVMDTMTTANVVSPVVEKETTEMDETHAKPITLTNQTLLDFSALQRWINEDANQVKCDTDNGFNVHNEPLNQSTVRADKWIDCVQAHPRQYRRPGRNKARRCTSRGGCTDAM
jgi:hypothetical protein